MNSWSRASLGDILPLAYGKSLPASKRIFGEVPVYSSAGHTGQHDTALVPGPCIIIGRKGTVGSVYYEARGCFPIDTTFYTTGSTSIDLKFGYYALLNANLPQYSQDSAVPGLNRNRYSVLEILLPPLQEQRAIVGVLGALDDKIVVNTKLADTTDTFIQFSFKDALQSSPTTREPLLDVFRFEFGEAFKGEYFVEPGAGRPLIRIRDLKTFSPQVWTMEARPKEILVEAGDVVVGMDAEFRATSWLGERGLLNQRVCRVTSDLAGNAFVREALREPLANIENYKTGTTVIHLNKKDLKSTSVVLPSKQAISSFENSTEELYSLRVALAAENRTLAETRDALLPQLMAGKLRVKDAEKVLEDVL